MGFFLALLLAGLFASPLNAAQLQICTDDKTVSWIREHDDQRIRSLFVGVLTKASMKVDDYSICEVEYPVAPQMLEVETRGNLRMFALLVPTYMRSFSDVELQGFMAHEVGHVAVGKAHGRGIGVEKMADAKGASWIGKEAMVAFLNSIRRELHRYSQQLHAGIKAEIDERLQALGALK
ncbi:MAG TPA: hypothetical protein VI483_02060 [Candidatus Paceibacterota bacterium]